MNKLISLFDRIDIQVTSTMSRLGLLLLRVSLGIVFFWFGALKFFPGMSPVQDVAIRTIGILAFGTMTPLLSFRARSSRGFPMPRPTAEPHR